MAQVPDEPTRLFGRASRHALYSRRDGVGHHPIHDASDAYEDQLFDIIRENNGEYPYIIKSKVTGKVLFARGSGNLLLGHASSDGHRYADQTFKFEPFGGAVASFRIISGAGRCIVSRTSQSPKLTTAPTSPKYSDQEFYFWRPGWSIPRTEEEPDQSATPNQSEEATLGR